MNGVVVNFEKIARFNGPVISYTIQFTACKFVLMPGSHDIIHNASWPQKIGDLKRLPVSRLTT